jgi:hypothetical protein
VRFDEVGAEEFELRAVNPVIAEVSLESKLQLLIGDDDAQGEIKVTVECRLVTDGLGDPSRIDVQTDRAALEALAAQIGHVPIQRCAVRAGVLGLELGAGRVLSAPPDERYEAWSVLGGGYRLICCPGGELAIWGPGDPGTVVTLG